MLGACELCGRYANLECHHVFGGANRKKSTKYGAMIYICHNCHNEPPNGLHFNFGNNQALKRKFQIRLRFENDWSIEDFIREFGKNYE